MSQCHFVSRAQRIQASGTQQLNYREQSMNFSQNEAPNRLRRSPNPVTELTLQHLTYGTTFLQSPTKMQVISLLLLALGATALPTVLNSTTVTDTTSPSASHLNNLEARWHYPWMGNSASACKTSELVGPRPQLKSRCVGFRPTTDWVSIFWGTGAYTMNEVIVYEKEDCDPKSMWVGKVISQVEKTDGSGNEPYTCLPVTAEDRRRWKAVSFISY